MFLTSLLVVGFVFISVILILVVLIQRPQGGGLSGAFGSGAGSGQTAFGAKTGDALTIATIIMFVVWLGSAVGLVFASRPPASQRNQPAVTAPEGSNDQGEEGASTEESGEAPPEAVEEPGQEPVPAEPGADTPDKPAPQGEAAPDEQPATPPTEPPTGGDG